MTDPFPRLSPRVEIEPVPLPGAQHAPVVDFSYVDAGGGTHRADFTDLTVDPDAEPGDELDYTWDFGDTAGLPTAKFRFAVNDKTVNFTDESFDVAPGFISSRLWTFGDGTTSTAQNPPHTYAAAGSYPVSLVVTDDAANQSAPFQRTVIIGGLGKPFGAFSMWPSATSIEAGNRWFNMSLNADFASTMIARLNAAEAKNQKLILAMTGGAHTRYTVPCGTKTRFEMAKWKAVMDDYNTPAIVAAVQAAVAKGIVLGASVMDEPAHDSWNCGVFFGNEVTKAVIDEMVRYVKSIFGPTLPVGCVVRYYWRNGSAGHGPVEFFRDTDFIVSQFTFRNGFTAEQERDEAMATAAANGIKLLFSINIMGGGTRIPPWSNSNPFCPLSTMSTDLTGGVGTNGNCRVTDEQLRDWGTVFLNVPEALGLILWRWDDAYMARNTDPLNNQAALADLQALAATKTAPSWRRGT